ncbi:probable signal peptidase complex subunit 2 isoform X1 [Mizuhopecten yessoensis]|uniref:probable signal peptidase complex subunit 2 isoform X1 n=1 Tax=Mizuhopecten yessoensis TaxID=6573 RepID=UPI000B45753F|nr:probable signal peptidase complex subunit 2 isoform X1 [Mizuhopecten yessoensis]
MGQGSFLKDHLFIYLFGRLLQPKESSEQDGWSSDEKPVKIDKWDSAALKNALDDGAKKVILEGFKLKESHTLFDLRLLICSVAVGFSFFALLWDYIKPFPESRPVLILCVLSYFVLMAVLTVYTTYIEKGIFLVALDKDEAGMEPDDVWELSSSLKKYDDKYFLQISVKPGTTQIIRSLDITKSVSDFFDENGKFDYDRFEPEVRILKAKLSESHKE